MDHPVKDIPAVLRKVFRGTPQEQNDALKAYFLPTASVSTPFLRVPPVPNISVAYLGVVNSHRIIYLLARLNKLLVKTLEFDIKSSVYDQRTATLTLQATQTISPLYLPFHKPTISSTLILRLTQRSIDARGRILLPGEDSGPLAMGVRTRLYVSELEGLVQPSEILKVFLPFVGGWVGWAVSMWVTAWLVLLASVLVPLSGFLPEAVVKNGDAAHLDKEQ
ncbi:hypothetical protein VUR80DRAFT_9552 [Thermomyces stellatus]